MKRFLLEISVILVLAVAAGLTRNYLVGPSLTMFDFSPPGELTREEKAVQFPEADLEMVRTMSQTPGTLLVDAREPLLYELGHIPGAVNLPIGHFENRYPLVQKSLVGASWIITYCSDLTCPDSHRLAIRLREAGIANILLYRGGMKEWQDKGQDVSK